MYAQHVSTMQAMACDAAILGSLIWHYNVLGIFPRLYDGLITGNLANGLKALKCFVDSDTGNSVCTVVARIAKRVDAVLEFTCGLDLERFNNGCW